MFLRQSVMEACEAQSAIMIVNGVFEDIFQPQYFLYFISKGPKLAACKGINPSLRKNLSGS